MPCGLLALTHTGRGREGGCRACSTHRRTHWHIMSLGDELQHRRRRGRPGRLAGGGAHQGSAGEEQELGARDHDDVEAVEKKRRVPVQREGAG